MLLACKEANLGWEGNISRTAFFIENVFLTEDKKKADLWKIKFRLMLTIVDCADVIADAAEPLVL